MTKNERDEKVTQMLSKSSCKIGIAPLTKKYTYAVCEHMTRKGILKRTEDLETRLQRTVKSLAKTWTKKYLRLTEKDWNEIKIIEMEQTNGEDSDIVFLTCATREDASRITANAKYLPNTNNKDDPRLVMYVDPRSKKKVQRNTKYCTYNQTKIRKIHPNYSKKWKTRLLTTTERKRGPDPLESSPPPKTGPAITRI